MLHGSCVSEGPACSRSAGGLAASGAVPGAAKQVTSLAPEERSAPQCELGTSTPESLQEQFWLNDLRDTTNNSYRYQQESTNPAHLGETGFP